jgi:hypothetical protein
MKNYMKFMVAVCGITVATFGSISNASAATEIATNVRCTGDGDCGYTPDCKPIKGTVAKPPKTGFEIDPFG